MYVQKPPASKRELVNRLLAHDFDGDLRNLGKGARVSRVSASVLEVRFDDIDRTFLISTHIPRNHNGQDHEDDWSAPLPTTRRRGSRQ